MSLSCRWSATRMSRNSSRPMQGSRRFKKNLWLHQGDVTPYYKRGTLCYAYHHRAQRKALKKEWETLDSEVRVLSAQLQADRMREAANKAPTNSDSGVIEHEVRELRAEVLDRTIDVSTSILDFRVPRTHPMMAMMLLVLRGCCSQSC